jgi:hypothetical protein
MINCKKILKVEVGEGSIFIATGIMTLMVLLNAYMLYKGFMLKLLELPIN